MILRSSASACLPFTAEEGVPVDDALYLYCVVGTGEARHFGALGVGGHQDSVITISYRDLSAVVSRLQPDDTVANRESILGHEQVLETVMRDHTILPVRFGTIAPNAEEVRTLLRTRYSEFNRWLRDLDGKVELGLKAFWRDARHLRDGRGSASSRERNTDTETAKSSGGLDVTDTSQTSLGVREFEQERLEVETRILAPLRPLAFDAILNQTYGDDMILNAAFLVDRVWEKEFDARVQNLASENEGDLSFRYVGPAPPYSFVNIVIKEEAEPFAGGPGRRYR